MTSQLLICETCGYDAANPEQPRRGALFAEQVERLALERGVSLRLGRTRCLMACQRHCSVLLRAPGKIAYVLGDFQPDQAAAQALLDYAEHYRISNSGQVPFRDWPQGIKGKFIARIPVLDD
ncbi:hypothetical protein DNJ95_06575 [Stutzerimonas kirkiae]|uniref:Metal-binding protein n=1 Tax=Stutzerimonas kirkiae TaxID=2211392 RepID=A0A4Q9R943_9GAMM|nr:DUF1636 domain-containing protein [Stutzerimonas kirkiae]TBU97193.1 hypothetical protein DNJ96_08930 [Stutzerimonas kirkiae]TBV03615.1 hypothetical protein DNJ95_06575 [Stutzerimonas kirkiae]TBV12507.1 hypothetical protein DNK01_14920 [Stutzerimonas kirkiae]